MIKIKMGDGTEFTVNEEEARLALEQFKRLVEEHDMLMRMCTEIMLVWRIVTFLVWLYDYAVGVHRAESGADAGVDTLRAIVEIPSGCAGKGEMVYSAKELKFVAALLDMVGCEGIGANTLEALVRKTRAKS